MADKTQTADQITIIIPAIPSQNQENNNISTNQEINPGNLQRVSIPRRVWNAIDNLAEFVAKFLGVTEPKYEYYIEQSKIYLENQQRIDDLQKQSMQPQMELVN